MCNSDVVSSIHLLANVKRTTKWKRELILQGNVRLVIKKLLSLKTNFIQDKYKDNLQDFLCSPMNSKPRNKLEKVNILLELALNIKVQRFIWN